MLDTDKMKPAIFLQKTLPFGASLSVTAFNRCSRSLWAVGAKKLLLPWLVFFDDFPMMVPAPLAPMCRALADMFMATVGWETSTGEKAKPFRPEFVALGVIFTPGPLNRRVGIAKNKPERLEVIRSMVSSFKMSGMIHKQNMDVFRGKMQFLELQLFSRVGRGVRQTLELEAAKSFSKGDEVDLALDWITRWISTAEPRLLNPPIDALPQVLFTDGAFEYEGQRAVASCGAILFDQRERSVHTFGIPIPEEVLRGWRQKGKEQYITEAELLPILLSKQLWRSRLSHSKVLTFVDSDPAKFMCIAGYSHVQACNHIIKDIYYEETMAQSWTWFARVPTECNPADAPSRLKIHETSVKWNATVYWPEVPSTRGSGSIGVGSTP